MSWITTLITIILCICATIFLTYLNNKSSEVTKDLKEYSNSAGDRYWKVIFNGHDTYIKWDKYEDAEFFYEHINSIPQKKYVFEYIEEHPYYILKFDKCSIFVIPKYNNYNVYAYSDLPLIHIFDFNVSNRQSLKSRYALIVNKTDWEEKTVLTNKSDKELQKELELNITNKDIKALQKIIQQYSDSVKLSQEIAKKLCENK